jgi:hypothetical protein
MKSTAGVLAIFLFITAAIAQQPQSPPAVGANSLLVTSVSRTTTHELPSIERYTGDAALPFPMAANPGLRSTFEETSSSHVDLSYMGDAALPFPMSANPALRNSTLAEESSSHVDLSYMGDAALPFPMSANPALSNRDSAHIY